MSGASDSRAGVRRNRGFSLLLANGEVASWRGDSGGREAARDYEGRFHRVVVAYAYADGRGADFYGGPRAAWFEPAGFCNRLEVRGPDALGCYEVVGLYGALLCGRDHLEAETVT